MPRGGCGCWGVAGAAAGWRGSWARFNLAALVSLTVQAGFLLARPEDPASIRGAVDRALATGAAAAYTGYRAAGTRWQSCRDTASQAARSTEVGQCPSGHLTPPASGHARTLEGDGTWLADAHGGEIESGPLAGSETIVPVQANTLADSISVDLPRDGVRALRAARQTEGAYILVKDEHILQAIAALGKAGIFAEPAGATAYAGLTQALAQGQVSSEDPVLVLNTGNGLKDVKSAMLAVGAAPVIAPELNAVRQALKI